MADAVDMASEIEAENVTAALARALQPIPDGVSGECDGCGEIMPRLINGQCGFCRDGRLPPEGWTPPAIPAANMKEPEAMPESKSITFVATGAVLAEIKRRTADGTSNNRAALDLVEAAIVTSRPAPPPNPALPTSAPAQPTIATIIADLNVVFGELAARADRPDQSEELAAATARADAAESKLAALREALAS